MKPAEGVKNEKKRKKKVKSNFRDLNSQRLKRTQCIKTKREPMLIARLCVRVWFLYCPTISKLAVFGMMLACLYFLSPDFSN